MKKFLIVPIVKSPGRGRFGPIYRQDWHVGLMHAINLNRTYPSRIAVITDFVCEGKHEADTYDQVLREHGVKDHLIIKEGLETVKQIETAKRTAKEREEQLVLISTFLHAPRVRYYAGENILHLTAWGWPRTKEVPRDISMILLAPIIRNCGLENWFVEKVAHRRESGKL